MIKRILGSLLLVGLVSSLPVYSAEYTINVQEAPLLDFIQQVGEITQRTFVYSEDSRGQRGPSLQSTVTIVSNSALDEDGVFTLLQSVLRVRGLQAVDDGEVTRIVPQATAKEWAYEPTRPGGDDIVSRVIRLKHVSGQEVARVLRGLITQASGHMAHVTSPNVIIISDFSSNVERAEALIRELDVPSPKESVVITMEYALVADIAAMLQEIHPEIVRSQIGASGPGSIGLIAFANENNNTLFLSGTSEEIAIATETVAKLDTPYAVTGRTQVFNLQHVNAADTAELLSELITGQVPNQNQGQNTTAGSQNTVIVADEGNNALLARANPSILTEIQNILDQIDVPRLQVLIEAAIVEVNVEENKTVGFEVGATDEAGEEVPLASTSITGILRGLLANLISNQDIDEDSNIGIGTSALAQISSPSLAIARLNPEGISFGAIITALTTNTNADLLSTPHVIALDNITSRIFVGQNVPFRSGVTNIADPSGQGTIAQVERTDVGINLEVTPNIRPDLSVHLRVESEISAVTSPALGIGESGFSDIVTNKREVTTTVVAKNGQTIVIGGLIRDDVNSTIRKVPGLGSIPYLGRLFRTESNVKSKRHLLIFLRPVVIESEEIMASTLDRKIQRIWQLRMDNNYADKDSEPSVDRFYDGKQ